MTAADGLRSGRAAASPDRSRLGRADVAALIALGLIAVGVPLVMSVRAGAIGIPSNDDWVYMIGATSLYRSGVIDMPGHTAGTLGQLVMAQPFLWLSGGASWAFTAFGLAMGLLLVASTYLLARRFVGTGSAVLVVAILLAFPGLLRQVASFMTDVPAAALGTLCLLIGVRWVQGAGGRLTLLASIAIGILAVSVREFAIAAPVAVLGAAWARSQAEDRRVVLIASASLVAGVAFVLLAASSLSSRGIPAAPTLSLSLYGAPAFMTLAAGLLPAVAIAVGVRIKDLQPVQLVAAIGLVAAGMVAVPDSPFLGNIWAPSGAVSDAVLRGTRDQVIAPRVWVLSEQLALLASVLLMALILRWGWRHWSRTRSPFTALAAALEVVASHDGTLVLFLVAYGAALAIFGSFFPLYDRYLLPLIPAAAILLLRPFGYSTRPSRSVAFSHAALAWLAASALLVAANSFAYDSARYHAGDTLVDVGYAPDSIDAGAEWMEFHATVRRSPVTHGDPKALYGDSSLPSRPCAVVSNDPLESTGYQLIREDDTAYLNYLFFGPPEPLYLYGAIDPGCPAPKALGATLQHGAE